MFAYSIFTCFTDVLRFEDHPHGNAPPRKRAATRDRITLVHGIL
jgi:hypothetical protein